MMTGNNQRRENNIGHENNRLWIELVRECNPKIPHRQPAYEDDLSEDEEYVEGLFRESRNGYHDMGEREPQGQFQWATPNRGLS